MANFETHPKKLKDDLLVLINNREIALPDFQRDFVWQPGQTHSLIVSLARRFPAGSLLRIESGADIFEPRAFSGAPPLDHHKPKYLMLDGQQRLTSLYQALYGKGEHRYYFSFRRLLLGEDLEQAYRVVRRSEAEKSFNTLEQQAVWGLMPLEVIFGGEGFHSWLGDVRDAVELLEKNGKNVGFSSDRPMERRIRTLYEEYVQPIVTYEFPVVTLAEDTSLEAVCTIFETLNNTGVKLSVFDLLSARFFINGTSLRQLWQTALDSTPLLKSFDIDPYYILQTVSAHVKETIQKSFVVNLEKNEVLTHWENAIWGMGEALKLLYEECGVLKRDLLSYNTILVPLATVFMQHRGIKGAEWGAFRNKIKRWYWCSVFSQTYESSPNSQTILDVREIRNWVMSGEIPTTIRNFSFEKDRLLETTIRQRALYRGLLCLILCNRPMDFHSTVPLTATVMEANDVDDHHIFPDAHLKKSNIKLKQTEIDSILNRTLIDRTTNQSIGANAPSIYLKKIATTWDDPGMLDKVLDSHFLPIGAQSSLRQDDFEAFRHERSAKLYKLILEATPL